MGILYGNFVSSFWGSYRLVLAVIPWAPVHQMACLLSIKGYMQCKCKCEATAMRCAERQPSAQITASLRDPER
jgi:hypothetical protein